MESTAASAEWRTERIRESQGLEKSNPTAPHPAGQHLNGPHSSSAPGRPTPSHSTALRPPQLPSLLHTCSSPPPRPSGSVGPNSAVSTHLLSHRSARAAALQQWPPLHLCAPSQLWGQRLAPFGSFLLSHRFHPPCRGHHQGWGVVGWRLSLCRSSGAESSPRPPAAAAVRSCLQQRALRDPPRPEQQRGRGALRGGRERGKGQSSEPPSVRRGRGGEGAPHPPQCPAPPPGTAAPAPPPPACGCRRSSAGGLEGRRGAVWRSSARPPQRCAPHSPALTAHVLPAGPVHRQHLQRVEDGAVRAHRAGVSARDEPQSGWSPPERISEPSDGSAPLLRRGSPARTPPLGSPPFTSRSSAAALRPPGCNWPGAPPRVSAARGRRGAVRAAPPHRPQPPSAKEDRRGAADWPRLTCSTASCPASSPSRLKDMAEPGAAPPSLWGAPTVRFRVLRPVVPRARTLTNGERGAS